MCGAFRGEMKYNLVKQVEKNNTQAEKKTQHNEGWKFIYMHTSSEAWRKTPHERAKKKKQRTRSKMRRNENGRAGGMVLTVSGFVAFDWTKLCAFNAQKWTASE